MASISGIVKNRYGNAIDCSTYSVRVNVYPKNNSSSSPTDSQTVTSATGNWSVSDLVAATKYLVTFEYEGTYTPTGDTDIAGAEFMTAA